MANLAHLSNSPSKVSYVLASNRLGVAGVVFFAVAAAAPLTTAAAGAVAGYAVTGIPGLPVAYAVITVIFVVFAVGYVAMSRHITNAGVLYTYVVQGLGRVPGVGASFVALLAYNAIQIGLYGIFGTALADLLGAMFAAEVPWWVCALAGWALVGLVGVLRVDLNRRVLAPLLIAECLVVVLYDLVFVSHPAGDEVAFASVDPANLLSAGWAASLAVAVAGFVGFEGSAVFAEEAKNPRRTVAKATFIALVFIGVIHTVSSWALSVITGPGNVVGAAQAQGPMLLFNLGNPYLGQAFTDLAQLLFVTSLFAALLSFHNTVARYLFSLGREEVLPRGLGATHYRTGSPYAGSVTQSVLAVVVLIAAAGAGVDPVLTLFFVGANLGAFGVLLLMTVTSFAVIAYFRARPHAETGWNRWVAPAFGGIALLGVLVLVFLNFHTLLRVEPDDSRSWVLPAAFVVVAIAGMLWGWFLKIQRPLVYRTIGLGANRVTGRAVSEQDSERGLDLLDGDAALAERGGGRRGGRARPEAAPARAEPKFQRLHTTGELDTLAGVLATAYLPDEAGEWLIPDPALRAQIYPPFFRIHVAHALRAGEVYASVDRSAVAIWYPAPYGVPDAGPPDYDTRLAALTGPYLPRFLAMDAALQAAHPIDKAHHYLSFMAVRPDHQGRGLGSALLLDRLGDLHRRGIPTYLEATNRRNLALFLHHGFTVIGTVRVPDDGPTTYRMWRDV